MQLPLPRYWLLNGSVLFYLLASTPTAAQIVPDTTLPNNSIVSPNCTNCEITGGTTVGNNLFHSLEQFSIPTDGSAYFNNAPTIENIISRVTGKFTSNIDGLIRANDVANLFLLNPNGIIFGANASLNIGGSFLATTADRIDFADGTQFKADGTQSSPLLTVSVPIGLQFGQAPGTISNQSRVPLADSTGNPVLDDNGNPIIVGLQVLPGKTLALVGGSIILPGGFLTASVGRIELGSVASPASVSLTPTDQGWMLGYNGIQTFQDISLSQAAFVNTIGDRGGDIQIQGRRVTLTQGSQVASVAQTEGQAGDLRVSGSEQVELTGTSVDGRFPSSFVNYVQGDATGEGGALTIETGQLIIQGGAQVSAATFGTGRGVDLTVSASESVELVGNSIDGRFASSLFARVRRGATGDGGTLTIETGQIIVRDGAQVSTDTFSAGRAGDLIVRASESVELVGRTANNQGSGLFAQVAEGATGDGGNLIIETERLSVLGGAQISTAARSGGQGGTLTVNASDSILLSGTAPSADSKSSSGIFVSAEQGASRNGGELNLTTGVLTVEDGAKISADTFSTSQAGNATLNVRQLIIRDGGQVGAGSFGEGTGGTLTVNASESVEVIGSGTIGFKPVNSALFTRSEAAGDAGNLNIATGSLNVRDRAEVTVSGSGSGDAGNLTVAASSIDMDDQATLSADTKAGQGNIDLNSVDLVLRNGSNITTNAEGSSVIGGNINIDTEILVALENSDIRADSRDFRGGNVTLTAQGIIGTEFRLAPTQESDITATGANSSLPGTVTLNTPDIDPSRGLTNLPAEVVDASNQIAQTCAAGGTLASRRNRFVVTGSGGLPDSPNETLSPDTVWEDLRFVENSKPSVSQPTVPFEALAASNNQPTTNNRQQTIVEAQGWALNQKGEVVLTANEPTVTPHSSWQKPVACPHS